MWQGFRGAAVRRLAVAAAVGVVVAFACAWFAAWQLTVLAGWVSAAIVLLAWILIEVMRLDPEQTSIHATTEDDSRVTAHLLLVGASSAALMGAAAAFVKASQTEGAGKLALTAAGVATVVVSWAVVHVVFTLRYAHEYYSDPAGGIDFKNDEPPDYQDFAYVAFTIGMTFQISDTDIQARLIRRTVLRHSLLAYVFGAVILAVTINVIANVIQ
jgi:uncharacterized membrane protein